MGLLVAFLLGGFAVVAAQVATLYILTVILVDVPYINRGDTVLKSAQYSTYVGGDFSSFNQAPLPAGAHVDVGAEGLEQPVALVFFAQR